MVNNFAGSEEKYLKTVTLYAKDSGDTYLYTDSAKTTSINRADLLNLCMKGLVVVSYKGTFYHPVCFVDNTTDVSVTIATVSSSAFAVVTLKSQEPVAG